MTLKNIKDQKGAGLTEYSLTLFLIALVSIISINTVGDAAKIKFGAIATALEVAGVAPGPQSPAPPSPQRN